MHVLNESSGAGGADMYHIIVMSGDTTMSPMYSRLVDFAIARSLVQQNPLFAAHHDIGRGTSLVETDINRWANFK